MGRPDDQFLVCPSDDGLPESRDLSASNLVMSFEQEGFSLQHERGSRSWPWNALSHFIESPHFFHLYFDSRSFFLVPKSGCKDKDEVYELRQLLKEKAKRK